MKTTTCLRYFAERQLQQTPPLSCCTVPTTRAWAATVSPVKGLPDPKMSFPGHQTASAHCVVNRAHTGVCSQHWDGI